ncbi:MAG: SPFH domain-containing protein [Gemmatimonadota bacterium]
MGTMVLGFVLLVVAVIVRTAGASLKSSGGKGGPMVVNLVSYVVALIAVLLLANSAVKVIDAGTVGVQHAFGKVSETPLLPGVRFVPPWSEVERYSTREEQFPQPKADAETMAALSSEQMGMSVDVAVRWKIEPTQAPRLYMEMGDQAQIEAVVLDAIRNGVRDGMAQFSINQLGERAKIADVMRADVDSALVTRPRAGGEPFRVASITAFYLRNLQPPEQVVAAINGKIAQEQQIETEKHRVEVARLQSDQQRLLNQTLTPEALMKQYLEVLHDMKTSNNLVILVPTEGGTPLLDLAALRKNLKASP